MQLIPFQIDANRYNVFVILEDANLERMKQYDPAQFDASKLPESWKELRLDTVIIGYATPNDLMAVRDLLEKGAPSAALEYLSRGFAFRPDQGDHDHPYTRTQ